MQEYDKLLKIYPNHPAGFIQEMFHLGHGDIWISALWPSQTKTLAVSKFVKPRLEPKSIPGMPGMPGKLPQDVPTDCFLQVLPGSLTNLAPAKFNITKGHKSLPTITSCG